jgi:hypothetical protein
MDDVNSFWLNVIPTPSSNKNVSRLLSASGDDDEEDDESDANLDLHNEQTQSLTMHHIARLRRDGSALND